MRDEKRPVEHRPEKYGNVDHQIKKARVQGMQLQAEKIAVESIILQVNVMKENADLFKSMHGVDKYKSMIVNLFSKSGE